MAESARAPHPSHCRTLLYWILLSFTFTIQTGPALPLGGGIGFTIAVYEILLPVVIGLVVIAKSRYQFSRSTITYGILLLTLTAFISFTGIPKPDMIRLVAHGLAATGALVAVALLSISSTTAVLYAIWLGAFPVVALDLAARVGIVQPANTASQVIPYTTYGGIGIPTGFGTHGVIINTAIISGIGVLWLCEPAKKTKLALKYTCFLMFLLQLFSQSRSSLLALTMGIVVLIIYQLWHSPYPTAVKIATIAVGSISLLGGGIVLLTQRVKTIFSRIEEIETAATLVTSNPITGIGWDTFHPNYSSKVLHFTPGNYFLAGGTVLGIIYIAVLAYPGLAAVRQLSNRPAQQKVVVFAALYIAVFVEILFFKSTPSVHVFSMGALLTGVISQNNLESGTR